MIFQRKYERARRLQKERMGDAPLALEDENLADKLEKKDTLALILSAMIVIIPAALLNTAGIVGAAQFAAMQ